MKKSQSNEFMEMLPRLLQAMKHVNDAGYVGFLSKNGADKLCHITKTLQKILKNSKGISISQKPYVIFDAVGILVPFDEQRTDKFICIIIRKVSARPGTDTIRYGKFSWWRVKFYG